MAAGLARGGLLVIALVVGLSWAGLPGSLAQDPPEAARQAKVFVYPHVLTPQDKLCDGKDDRPIEIQGPTTLVWIDRMPQARFEHPTEYVLISSEGTRVVDGGWWPLLNGKELFRDGKTTAVEFPVALPPKGD